MADRRAPPDVDLGDAATEAPEASGASLDEPAPGDTRGYRAIEIGAALDRYTIEAELGAGGMATVYRARDRELRREVAIKILFPHLAKKKDVVRRFSREARAAAGLDHPHVLRVYDVGGGAEPGGDPPFIVMELVRGGGSLRELAEAGALGAELVASIGAVVCDALAVAHAAGVVHRDVKPGNVLVAAGGRLLLADFGVARLDDDDSVVTRTGALLGTPSFMSPEQAQGQDIDVRSDLYSVGATLYQLATASLPFAGPTARVVAQIVRGELTPPLRRAPSMGPDLARAIEAMMAIDRAKRPASAVAAAAVLREVAAAGGVADVEAEIARFFADPAAYRAARPAETARVVVARARDAIARRQLARAIALADRAAALAPDDALVISLVDDLARGDRRRRRVVIGGAIAALAIVGGGVATIAMWPPRAQVAAIDAQVALAPAPPDAAIAVGSPPDASPPDAAPTEIALAPPPPDAATAHRASSDAAIARHAPPPDAAPPEIATTSPLDAAVALIAPPPPDARPSPAHVTLAMDAWCDLAIDGVARGRASRAPIELAPGRHTIVCSQGPGLATWSDAVDLAPGDDRTITGTLLAKVAVTLDLDARIDGAPHRRGDVVPLAPGRHRVDPASGAGGWISVTPAKPCHLRAAPELDCF